MSRSHLFYGEKKKKKRFLFFYCNVALFFAPRLQSTNNCASVWGRPKKSRKKNVVGLKIVCIVMKWNILFPFFIGPIYAGHDLDSFCEIHPATHCTINKWMDQSRWNVMYCSVSLKKCTVKRFLTMIFIKKTYLTVLLLTMKSSLITT